MCPVFGCSLRQIVSFAPHSQWLRKHKNRTSPFSFVFMITFFNMIYISFMGIGFNFSSNNWKGFSSIQTTGLFESYAFEYTSKTSSILATNSAFCLGGMHHVFFQMRLIFCFFKILCTVEREISSTKFNSTIFSESSRIVHRAYSSGGVEHASAITRASVFPSAISVLGPFTLFFLFKTSLMSLFFKYVF